MAISLAYMYLCILLAMLVLTLWLSCLYVSILACCSALCIFEKHMLVFVYLIHALPTRGGSTKFMFPGGALHRGKKIMHLFRGNLHSCIWELFFA
jgi:hypothetical protein